MRLEELSVTHRMSDVNGLRMHWVEKGQGPLVVLLHGFPEMWWAWRHQLEPLAAAGYRVVAPDLRGYGETDTRGPYDLTTLADDVRGLIHVLGQDQAVIVGHDWGGSIGWLMAATMPELVRRLVIMNSPHPAQFQAALRRSWRQATRLWYMLLFQLPVLPELRLRRHHGAILARTYRAHARDRTHFSDEEIAPFRDNVMRPGVAHAMLGYYRAMPGQLWAARHHPAANAAIQARTLLVWGMDDRTLGYDALVPGIERLVPRIRIEPIAGAGHFVMAERPDLVNPKLLGFLAEGGA